MSVNFNFTMAGQTAPEVKEKLRKIARSRGVSLSELLTEAVIEWLKKYHAGQKRT